MKLLIIALALISFTQSSMAEDSEWSLGLGVGPNLSNLDAVGDDLKSSVGAAAWMSRSWGEMNRFDISFDYFKFSGDSQNYPSLNLAYGLRFLPHSRLKPFALIGAGLGQANRFPRADNRHQTCFNLFGRAGVDHILYGQSWSVGLMADFEHVFMDGDDVKSAQLALPMLTFVYRLGSSTKSEAAPRMAIQEPPKPKIDSDGDGVFDDKDECPDTPAGARVNSIGCQPKQKVTKTLKVEFETGKDKIRENFMDELDEFGKFMAENADLNVVIEGHTDTVGSRKLNLDLSRRRAAAVRKALIERWQLQPERLKSAGFGPDQPIADNNSPEGRQLNRRVNAVLQSN